MVRDAAAPQLPIEAPVPPSHRRRPSLRGFSLRPSRHAGLAIGDYRVEGSLGQGGTADVFLARDEHTRQLVVIKRLKAHIAENPELRRRFLLEAEALASIDHPAVIRVLDIQEPDEGPPWLTLEALKGESLGDYLKKNPLVEPELALRIARETAHALEAVHAAGVVHRDVKPDNLFLVGPLGEPDHVKVLDFGMARLSGEEHDETSTSILGTAQYMAPEQILVEPVDARTDVYALGVVLFRLVTGHLPFDAQDPGDLLRHQLFSPVPPPSWLVDDLPPGLEEIVLRATRKAPRYRYASMREFGRDLDEIFGLVSRTTLIPPSAPLHEPSSLELSDFVRPREPDVYEPVSERGKNAARILAKDFGPYASQPPPEPDA